MFGTWLGQSIGQWFGASLGSPVDPPSPPVVGGGFGAPSRMARRPDKVLFLHDDRDLLELVPMLVEVINGRR